MANVSSVAATQRQREPTMHTAYVPVRARISAPFFAPRVVALLPMFDLARAFAAYAPLAMHCAANEVQP